MDSKISELNPVVSLLGTDILPIVNGGETKKITVDNLIVNKVDKVVGKGLSTNDYTNTDKSKLDGIQVGAEVNVNADWNATVGDAVILNKPTIPITTNFVPYIGSVSYVDLGEFGLKTGNLEFDLTPTNTPTAIGSMYWNNTDGTLDLKLKGGNVTLQIGQETVARVVNKTSTNISLLEANYQAVRVTGAQGQRPKVDLALAINDLNSAATIGLVTETILNNGEGFITTSGQVKDINTTGSLQGETWLDGDVLYLSGLVAGSITNIKPIAPIHTVIIGFVEYAHAINGKIFVKVDNGYELDELHNVHIETPLNNDVLQYESSTSLWKNKSGIVREVIKDVLQKDNVTGTTAETLVSSYLIPANTFSANDNFRIPTFLVEKIGASGTLSIRVKVGSTNVFSSSTSILLYSSPPTNVYMNISRSSLMLRNGVLRGYSFSTSNVTDLLGSLAILSQTNFDTTVDNYVFTSVQLSNAADVAFQDSLLLTN